MQLSEILNIIFGCTSVVVVDAGKNNDIGIKKSKKGDMSKSSQSTHYMQKFALKKCKIDKLYQ